MSTRNSFLALIVLSFLIFHTNSIQASNQKDSNATQLKRIHESQSAGNSASSEKGYLGEKVEVKDKLVLPERVTFNRTDFIILRIAAMFGLIFLALFILWILRGRPKQLTIRETIFLISFVFAGLIVSIGAFVTMLLEGEQRQAEIEASKYRKYARASAYATFAATDQVGG